MKKKKKSDLQLNFIVFIFPDRHYWFIYYFAKISAPFVCCRARPQWPETRETAPTYPNKGQSTTRKGNFQKVRFVSKIPGLTDTNHNNFEKWWLIVQNKYILYIMYYMKFEP